jgi:predicted nucleic acid-binding protein
MSVEFVDTNVLVYAHDVTAGEKRQVATSLLARLARTRSGRLSVQVLTEFYVTVTRKVPHPLSPELAAEIVSELAVWPVFSPEAVDVIEAIRLAQRYGVSLWDALIVRAAVVQEASVLWSEDLSDGQEYEGVVVRNPFRPKAQVKVPPRE